jgi:hypothetical protein
LKIHLTNFPFQQEALHEERNAYIGLHMQNPKHKHNIICPARAFLNLLTRTWVGDITFLGFAAATQGFSFEMGSSEPQEHSVIIHPLTPELRQRGVRTSPEFKLGKH